MDLLLHRGPLDSILLEIAELHNLYNLQVEEWVAGYRGRGGRIYCGRGCSNCCRLAVNGTFPEAVWVARHLPVALEARLDAYVAHLLELASQALDLKGYLRSVRNLAGGCPFLAEDGACGVYVWRPLSCRSLLSTGESAYCAVDFAAMDAVQKQAFVSGLDRSVVRFPTAYVEIAQQLAQQLEGLILARMLSRTGVALSGNMAYMVWLERRHDLVLRLSRGTGELLRYLAGQGLARHYLLDVQKGERRVQLTPRRES